MQACMHIRVQPQGLSGGGGVLGWLYFFAVSRAPVCVCVCLHESEREDGREDMIRGWEGEGEQGGWGRECRQRCRCVCISV